MKIKADFLMKNVAGRNIVVPVGSATLNFNAMLTLNETGAFLFSLLQEKDMNKDELVLAITENYEVSKEIASADIDAFIEKITAAGIVE